MEAMVSGWAVNWFDAWQIGSMMSSKVSKTVFASQLARRYWQTFSTGFSSGARDGSQIGVILSGMSSLPDVCQPARSKISTTWAPAATVARDLIEMKLHRLGVGMRK